MPKKPDELTFLRNLDTKVFNGKEPAPKATQKAELLPAPFELREYQKAAIGAVITDLADNAKVGIIMPTGAGKTEVFTAVTDRFLQDHPGKSVLILSHLSLLTEQTSERFKLRAPHIPLGIFQADKVPSITNRVVIGTMQTSRDEKKIDHMKMVQMYPVGLIIVDEAHYLDNPSYNKVISYFPDAKIIGCTATPFRAGALMTSYFDKVSFSISLQELIEQGHLVPPKLIEVDLGAHPTTDDRMAIVAKLYKEREAGKRALIFMDSIDSAKQMRNVLDHHGVKARAITSELVGEARDEILRDFRAGKIDVLTTVNVLTAGFDSPNVEAIFMPFATQSPVTYLQRIGRGLRPCPEVGKTECRIYVCGDAPSIKRELYKTLHQAVLEKGSKKAGSTTFLEDAEYNDYDPSSEIYIWTQQVVHTIKKMEAIGMERLAKMLNEKRFPPKFLRDISTFSKAIPASMPKLPGGEYAMTEPQMRALVSAGFTPECLAGMTKNEASAMIATTINQKEAYRATPFIIPSGKFAGQHVKNTSFYYRKWIFENAPNGEIASLLRAWEKQGGKYEKR